MGVGAYGLLDAQEALFDDENEILTVEMLLEKEREKRRCSGVNVDTASARSHNRRNKLRRGRKSRDRKSRRNISTPLRDHPHF